MEIQQHFNTNFVSKYRMLFMCDMIIFFLFCIIITSCSNKNSNDGIVHLEITSKNIKSIHEYDKCKAKIEQSILKKEFGNAEFYIKSFRNSNLILQSIASLEQAYIDEGYVEKAVKLFKWAFPEAYSRDYERNIRVQTISIPLYEYYMDINEYSLAEEFLYSNNHITYYQHLERCVKKMILLKEQQKAINFIKSKANYFSTVEEIWKSERDATKYESNKASIDRQYKPYFKNVVINNLMSLLNEGQNENI